MPALIPIDEHITAIDQDLFGIPDLGMTYVVRGDPDRIALVETGTSLSVPTILAGLDALGIPRDAPGFIICTHIHMDHAGGAGTLAAALPRAHVYINSSVAQHLVDPSRLIASTRRAVGEALWPLQGTIDPLPPERLRPAEMLRLDLGRGVALQAIATPGHSPDHLAFFEHRSGALISGDAAGIALPRYGIPPRPVTPPPSFDLDQQLATYERLRTLPIERLLVTHGGPVANPAAALREQHLKLLEIAELVRAAVERDELVIPALAARLLPVESPPVLRIWAEMSIAGLARYFRTRRDPTMG
jgi:glyoxylase-like metal-dependent hydrolase (beta-lactamase superfamily II)